MTTLTDFLLARIAEDEAERVIPEGDPDWPFVRRAEEWAESNRWLAECEAKRRIVERAAEDIHRADAKIDTDQITRSFNAGAAYFAHNALLTLALPYADHPQFQEEWRA